MSNLTSVLSLAAMTVQPASAAVAKTAPVAPVQAARSSTTPKPETVAAAAMELQARAQQLSPALEFKVDDATRRTVVIVRDTETGDVIRQIPSEEALHLAQQLATLPSAILGKEA